MTDTIRYVECASGHTFSARLLDTPGPCPYCDAPIVKRGTVKDPI